MKRVYLVLAGVGFVGLLYYFVLLPYEFQVNFEAKTLPGDLIETIRIWNKSLEDSKSLRVNGYSRLEQTISMEGSTYRYLWNFESVNDSATLVNIKISEPERKLMNKLMVPFSKPKIEKDAEATSKLFIAIVKEHLEITRVKIIGEAQLDSSFCVCRELQTKQNEKAIGMMRDYSLLSSFINDHQLKPKGAPMVRVDEWDHESGTLTFNFCFPIEQVDSIPDSNDVLYKKFGSQSALKAEYRGNYITSDRAWYALLDYANDNGYKISATPIEYFYDNPNMGLNEQNWKADVYLPLVNN